jgi:hypothetical protein
MTELQALQNAISSLPKVQVYEKQFEDKRKTTKKYYLTFNGGTISPVLDYENLNHFILGFSKAKNLFTYAG